MTLEEALRRFGDRLSFPAIGAIAKRALDVRVIFDATRSVLTNYTIRVRDHFRWFTAADIKAWLCEQAREGASHFALVYDIAQAHRQFQVLHADLWYPPSFADTCFAFRFRVFGQV